MEIIKNNYDFKLKDSYICKRCDTIFGISKDDILFDELNCYMPANYFTSTRIGYVECPVCGYRKDVVELDFQNESVKTYD